MLRRSRSNSRSDNLDSHNIGSLDRSNLQANSYQTSQPPLCTVVTSYFNIPITRITEADTWTTFLVRVSFVKMRSGVALHLLHHVSRELAHSRSTSKYPWDWDIMASAVCGYKGSKLKQRYSTEQQ
jgi:hypothetical protein